MDRNTPFKKLEQLPMNLYYMLPRPIFHPKDHNHVLVSTDLDERDAGIYKYNLKNNSIKCITKLEETQHYHKLEEHAQFIDIRHNALYMIGGTYNAFMTYNINTETVEMRDELKVGDCAKVVHVKSSTKDEIHILGTSKHCKFDCIQQQMTEICNNNVMEYSHLSLNPITRQLMILGGQYDDDIWTFDTEHTIDQNNNVWKLNDELKMPHCVEEESYYDVLLVGDIIFVFYFNAADVNQAQVYNDIWWLDLWDDKWYKSEYNVPDAIQWNSYAIKSGNSNDIHFLDFHTGSHFKIHSYDLLSMEFIRSRRHHYNPLIIGYVKEQEKRNKVLNVPFVLKLLILEYFPVIDPN